MEVVVRTLDQQVTSLHLHCASSSSSSDKDSAEGTSRRGGGGTALLYVVGFITAVRSTTHVSGSSFRTSQYHFLATLFDAPSSHVSHEPEVKDRDAVARARLLFLALSAPDLYTVCHLL